jgi:hypothetical protein
MSNHGWPGYSERVRRAFRRAAGNRYGKNEIRAIFYTRRELQLLREELAALPPPKEAWQQIEFQFWGIWKTKAQR